MGNSTCAFTETVFTHMHDNCNVYSICNNQSWDKFMQNNVSKIRPQEWFAPLTTFTDDINTFDYTDILSNTDRILIFWDAHGFDIAETVLSQILPQIANKDHLVIMHDMSDNRYCKIKEYENGNLWKSNFTGTVVLGNILSRVEQSISIVDFSSRNELPLHSADHALHQTFDKDHKKRTEMINILSEDLFSTNAHWLWFTLNEINHPIIFPTKKTRP